MSRKQKVSTDRKRNWWSEVINGHIFKWTAFLKIEFSQICCAHSIPCLLQEWHSWYSFYSCISVSYASSLHSTTKNRPHSFIFYSNGQSYYQIQTVSPQNSSTKRTSILILAAVPYYSPQLYFPQFTYEAFHPFLISAFLLAIHSLCIYRSKWLNHFNFLKYIMAVLSPFNKVHLL